MKKVFIASVVLLTLFTVGCGESKQKKLEKAFETAARDYYKNYQMGVENIDAAEVTIEMLKEANEKVGAKYNVEQFKDCKQTSKATLTRKKDSKEIEKVEIELNCEK